MAHHGAAAPTPTGSLNAAASGSRATRSGGGDVAPQLADGARQVAVSANDPRWSEAIRTFKRDLLEQTLERTHGNRTHAARALGLQRTYHLKLIRELGMRRAPAHLALFLAGAHAPASRCIIFSQIQFEADPSIVSQIQFEADPSIAAASALQIAIVGGLLLLVQRLFRLRLTL